jgi:disulfide bond formation protein DsbB
MITPDTAELFFALLTLVANAAVVAGVGLWAASRWSKGAAVFLEDLRVELTRFGVPLAFAVAGTAMLGSLYFSEVANFVPCTLCWFQRVAMYSLAIILLVATIRRDRNIRVYGITLALVGVPISVYHYLVEWYPTLETDVCSTGLSCSIVWFRSFGYMSLAYMAGSAFVLIALVLALTPPPLATNEELP